jgi:hypothetical protein
LFSRDPQQGDEQLSIPANGTNDATLNAPFFAKEVSEVLISKRGHWALGPDGFSLDHLKVFRYDETTCQALAKFFNICVQSAEIPEIWEHAFLHVLYKGKGPLDNANIYHAITLKSQLLKLLESLLCRRISHLGRSKSSFAEQTDCVSTRENRFGSFVLPDSSAQSWNHEANPLAHRVYRNS